MSLSLKHIPCPAGENCTAFQCIFGHESDKPQAAPAAAPEPTRSELESDQKEPPRKRTKIEPNGTSQPPKPATEPATTLADAQGSPVKPHKVRTDTAHAQVHTTLRPVSPPPLKRPRPPSSSSSPQRTGASPSKTVSRRSPIAKATGSSSATTSRPQKKAESLNPRLLKTPPASHELRFKLLAALHKEYARLNTELKQDASDDEAKLVLSDQQLIVRALDEEQAVAIGKAAVYSNVMKNKLLEKKRMKVLEWKTLMERERAASREKHGSGDSSDAPKKIETGLTSAQEVQVLERLLTPIANLAMHGYVSIVPTEEAIQAAREGKLDAQGWEQCDRCNQRFQVFPGRREEDGLLTSGGACKFHWGKMYLPHKEPGDKTRIPKRYRCCNEDVGESAGCITCDHHVFKTGDAKTLATVLNFVKTPENPLAPTDRAVCFDCEMGYTVHGMELIRLTAVSWPTGEELLDVLVRPVGEILDLNSRYSGVLPEHLARAKLWSEGDPLKPTKSGDETASEEGEVNSEEYKKQLMIVSSPKVARDLLFSLISPTTPLIGHGLENDLNSVRIVHPTLIDTVLLFPHKMGLPYRHGLKALMQTQLNRKIQQETDSKMLGHDSAEDARAAGELVRLKVMEEWGRMRRLGWSVDDNGDLQERTSWYD